MTSYEKFKNGLHFVHDPKYRVCTLFFLGELFQVGYDSSPELTPGQDLELYEASKGNLEHQLTLSAWDYLCELAAMTEGVPVCKLDNGQIIDMNINGYLRR